MLSYSTQVDTNKLPAVFKIVPVRMGALSEAAGRDVWEDREYIEIYLPGGKTVISKEPTEEEKRMYAMEYKAFKDGLEGVHEGTSIEILPRISPAQIENLKSLKIFTVENLCNYPDGRIGDLGMGGRELQTRAKEYLKAADSGKYVLELKNQLAAQQEQINALLEKLEDKDKPKAKPGKKVE